MAGRLSKVDIKAVPAGSVYDYQVKSREARPQLLSRLRIEEADARFERWKGLIGYVAVVIGSLALGAGCFWIAARPDSSSEDKKWATVIGTSILSLWGGFVAGNAKAKKT